MTGRIKKKWLACLAVLAVSGVVASAAQAAEVHSGSWKGTTYLTIEQAEGLNVFHTPAGNVSCKTLNFAGSFSGTTASDFTLVAPTLKTGFEGCTAFGLSAHVETMGCSYTVTGSTALMGIVHLVCPTTAGGVMDEITITPTQGGVAICHINIPSQTINVNIINTSQVADDLDLYPTSVATYNVERTLGGSKCPTNGHHNDGAYTGGITVRAFQDESHFEPVHLTYT